MVFIPCKLEAIHTMKNLERITEFVSELLPNIIHYRNQLKNIRTITNSFREHHEAAFIDIDFSKKSKIPIKFQAQSQHWNKRAVIIHSGILHIQGVKSYHAYICLMTNTKIKLLYLMKSEKSLRNAILTK